MTWLNFNSKSNQLTVLFKFVASWWRIDFYRHLAMIEVIECNLNLTYLMERLEHLSELKLKCLRHNKLRSQKVKQHYFDNVLFNHIELKISWLLSFMLSSEIYRTWINVIDKLFKACGKIKEHNFKINYSFFGVHYRYLKI